MRSGVRFGTGYGFRGQQRYFFLPLEEGAFLYGVAKGHRYFFCDEAWRLFVRYLNTIWVPNNQLRGQRHHRIRIFNDILHHPVC